jgi:hypothetical protein
VTRTKVSGSPVVAAPHWSIHAPFLGIDVQPHGLRALPQYIFLPPSAAYDQRGRGQKCLSCPNGTPTPSPMLLILCEPKLIGLYDGNEDVQLDARFPGGDIVMGLWDLMTDRVPEKAFPGGDRGVVEGRHCIQLYALPSTCQPRVFTHL